MRNFVIHILEYIGLVLIAWLLAYADVLTEWAVQ